MLRIGTRKIEVVGMKKKYTSIQVTPEFKALLKKSKDVLHFDSYENTIKYLMKKGDRI